MDRETYEELSGGVAVDPRKVPGHAKKQRHWEDWKTRTHDQLDLIGWGAIREHNQRVGRNTAKGGIIPTKVGRLGIKGNVVLGGGPLRSNERRPSSLMRFGYGQSRNDR
jgi:hypothetical protein